MNEDPRYVPSEEDMDRLRSLREARRLMGMIATGLVLAFTILLAIQHYRGPRDHGPAKKSQSHSVCGTNRPSSSSPGKP